MHACRRDRRASPTSSRSARTTSRRRRSASRATTRRGSSSRTTSSTASWSATRSRCSTSTGVGDLMRIAVERGRGVKPDLKLGICGEHGGEPRSVAFCHELGLDYVSLLAVPRAAGSARRRPGGARRRGASRLSPSADRVAARVDGDIATVTIGIGVVLALVVLIGSRARCGSSRRRTRASSSGSAATTARSTRACTSWCRSSTRCKPLVDMREQVVTFPPQPVITQDNVTISIDTVFYFTVTDPFRATYEVADLLIAVEQLTVTTLRNVIGSLSLEEALTSRDKINADLRIVLDEATERWGMRVNRIELKSIDPPASIQEAMEKQMRAERDKRAAILTPRAQAGRDPHRRGQTTARRADDPLAEGDKQAAILRATGRGRGDAPGLPGHPRRRPDARPAGVPVHPEPAAGRERPGDEADDRPVGRVAALGAVTALGGAFQAGKDAAASEPGAAPERSARTAAQCSRSGSSSRSRSSARARDARVRRALPRRRRGRRAASRRRRGGVPLQMLVFAVVSVAALVLTRKPLMRTMRRRRSCARMRRRGRQARGRHGGRRRRAGAARPGPRRDRVLERTVGETRTDRRGHDRRGRRHRRRGARRPAGRCDWADRRVSVEPGADSSHRRRSSRRGRTRARG